MAIFTYEFLTKEEAWNILISCFISSADQNIPFCKAIKNFMVANFELSAEEKNTFNGWLSVQCADAQIQIGFIPNV